MTFLGRWTSDAEGQPLRAAAARREDAELYLKLCRQRDNRVRLRSLISLLASVFGLAAVVVLWVMTSTATLLVLASAVVLALGVAGAPVDEPLITRAVVKAKAPKLTSDMVIRALESLGIGGITSAKSKGSGITFPAPIMRDGPGWRADVELPHGVEVADVMGRRGQLASGLRRPLGTVWPEQAPGEHPGRMVLWVGDQDMATAKQPAWPLARKGTVDLFDPIAFATDQRGNWVSVTLMFIAGIIGAVPRMGKTFLLRLLLLIAALDPRAELHTYDLKGTGDLDPVGDKVSHRHRAGDDEEDIEYAIADLRELREELRRRTKVIRSLPRDICPESKVTSKLADTKSLRLHPIMVGVDECQVWFEHPKYGAEFEEICTDLVKRGPATGIVLLLATQRPDAKSLPTGISANAILRLCLKVMGQVENDMVLGTSAYKRGCGRRRSPGQTGASPTTSAARARTRRSSARCSWTPPPRRRSPSAAGRPASRPGCCPATPPAGRTPRPPRRPRPTTCSPTSSPSSAPTSRSCGPRPSSPASASCGPMRTGRGPGWRGGVRPTNW